MMSEAAVSECNSVRKQKFKRSADDLTAVQTERKRKRKTDREKSEVCELSQSFTEENIQIPSTDTTNTDKHKHKKKRKKEIPQDVLQIENTTFTQDENHTKKKKKKKKHKECEVIVAEADVVTLQEVKHKTHMQTVEESAENAKKKKRKQRKTEVSGDVENTPVSGVEDEDGSGKEEDLSPEERRVLERKLKKIRKKEEKKKMKEEGKSTKQERIKMSVAEKQALEYLTCWSERRDEWRFQKTRQTWLLQHMYDSVKVPDSYFGVLLCYLKGLCGAARETSRQKAEVLERWEGQTEENTTEAEKKKHRAKLVLQTL